MRAIVLSTDGEISQAKQLLYSCYVQHQGWTPPAKNPSGFRVATLAGKSILTDDLEDRSMWLGVLHNNELIACSRILKADYNGLEFAQYVQFQDRDPLAVELNRFAIAPSYANSPAFPLLVKFAMQVCVEFGFSSVYTTMSFPDPATFAMQVGFQLIEKTEFKYDLNDPRAVNLFKFDLRDKKAVAKFFNIFESLAAA